MRHEGRDRPQAATRDRHPAATLLAVEAVGLVILGATAGGSGAVVAAGLLLVLAAVAAGLAASIAEGFRDAGAAVVVFEGVALAVALSPRSAPAGLVVLGATAAAWWCLRQMRRPVSCQYASRSTRL
ncbi:MAG TPA: hypothetical protein VLV81_00795 [Acidimicrobiia bacterium]|nr:hypothetical protein [Acidimicrobiia bacterium]